MWNGRFNGQYLLHCKSNSWLIVFNLGPVSRKFEISNDSEICKTLTVYYQTFSSAKFKISNMYSLSNLKETRDTSMVCILCTLHILCELKLFLISIYLYAYESRQKIHYKIVTITVYINTQSKSKYIRV